MNLIFRSLFIVYDVFDQPLDKVLCKYNLCVLHRAPAGLSRNGLLRRLSSDHNIWAACSIDLQFGRFAHLRHYIAPVFGEPNSLTYCSLETAHFTICRGQFSCSSLYPFGNSIHAAMFPLYP